MPSQQQKPSNDSLVLGLIAGILVSIIYLMGQFDKTKSEDQQYRELRDHEDAKKLGHAMYEWKKENAGR